MANNYRSLLKTVSFNKRTEQAVLDFVNAQENFSDTVLYLIQKEICMNGITNLQQIIPSSRTIADVQRLLSQSKINVLSSTPAPTPVLVQAPAPDPKENVNETEEVDISSPTEFIADTTEIKNNDDDLDEIPPELLM